MPTIAIGWQFTRMLELTESYEMRPEAAMRELSRARRIKDSLMDRADEKTLQDYISELEAFLDRIGLI